jgi:uncharacterized membrane protein YgcG
VAAGRRKPLTLREKRTITRAVDAAERRTGLQFCVYLGPGLGSAREHAERAFLEAGLHERPAVLVLVAANHRRVDIVTAPAVRDRVTDDACGRAVSEMTPKFADGHFVQGLVTGIELLAEAAGPGTAPSGATDLPDVIE